MSVSEYGTNVMAVAVFLFIFPDERPKFFAENRYL
jgi:hypothetical protein